MAVPERDGRSRELRGPSRGLKARTEGAGGIAGPTCQGDRGRSRIRADYTATLTALSAIQREVEALGPNLASALQLIADRAQVFTNANGAAIALSENNEMVCRASAGDAPPIGAVLDIGSGFSGYCARTGYLQRCDDAETDLHVDRESCRLLGIRSIIAVPIRLGETVIGLVEVFSSRLTLSTIAMGPSCSASRIPSLPP